MKKVAIGVDIGGTNVKYGLVGSNGRILFRDHFPTGGVPGRAGMLKAVSDCVRRLASLAGTRKWRLLGVGVGAPGPIDVERGFIYFLPNIRGWKNTALKTQLEKRLKLPVFVDNDANAMALAEFLFGAGRGSASLIALTLGTGVGGGMVLDGRLFHGHRYSAAEIGHLTVNENGPRCACGSTGCLEVYVGNSYFVRRLRNRLRSTPRRSTVLRRWLRDGRLLTPELAAKAARRGDRLCREIWKETGLHLGTALAGLANVLNPERIILGGGVANAGALLFDPIRETLKKKAFPIAARSARVMPAKLGVDAGLAGAAALVFAGTRR